jgi:hypothetical protein
MGHECSHMTLTQEQLDILRPIPHCTTFLAQLTQHTLPAIEHLNKRQLRVLRENPCTVPLLGELYGNDKRSLPQVTLSDDQLRVLRDNAATEALLGLQDEPNEVPYGTMLTTAQYQELQTIAACANLLPNVHPVQWDPKVHLDADKIKYLRDNNAIDLVFHYKREIKKLQQLERDLKSWCTVLPVFGFNSGKYDMNIIRKHLLPYLCRSQKADLRIIKNGNTYKLVESQKLKFLDVTMYLAAGTSYDKWLRAFNVQQHKFFWPHDWFTSLDVSLH